MADVPLDLVMGLIGPTDFGVDTHGDGPPHLPSVALDEDEVPHAVVGVRGAPGLLLSNVVLFHESNILNLLQKSARWATTLERGLVSNFLTVSLTTVELSGDIFKASYLSNGPS